MHRIILFLLLLMSYTAQSQYTNPPYTPISTSGYWWKLPSAFSYISLPAGCDTATAFHTLQSRRMGAFFTDTCDMVSYIWMGYWKPVGSGGSIEAANGLTKSNDTIKLGGTLLDTTQITMPFATRFRMIANGASPYMLNEKKPAWWFFNAHDTVPNNTYSNYGPAGIFSRTSLFTTKERDYPMGWEIIQVNQVVDSVYLSSQGGDFGYALRSERRNTRAEGNDQRSVFQGGQVYFDAVPNFIAWDVHQRRSGQTSSQRSRGWWSGVTSYPITTAADTLDYWIGFLSNSRIVSASKVLKFYDFYAGGGNYSNTRVDSTWSFFSDGAKPRMYHGGPVAFGGGNTGPTEQFELSGNFKWYNPPSLSNANDSMVVWNESTKLLGKRPIGGSSALFARDDARNNSGNDMYFSAAGEDFTIDSVGEYSVAYKGVDAASYFNLGDSYGQIEVGSGDHGGSLDVTTYYVRINSAQNSGPATELFVTHDSVRINYSGTQGRPVGYDTTLYKLQARNVVSGALVDTYWPVGGGGSGVTTVGTFSGSSIANGASISGSTITFGPADGTNPGMLTTGPQVVAGVKTLNNIAQLNGGFLTGTSAANANLWVATASGGTSSTAATYLFGPGSGANLRVGMRGSGAATITANYDAANMIMGTQVFNESGSGTHGVIAGLGLMPPTINDNAATVTTTATLYIKDAPSTTATEGNHALMVAAGSSRFGGAMRYAYRTVSANDNVSLTSDHVVEVTANSPTLTLPSATDNTGLTYIFINSGAGTAVIATTSSQVIGNSGSATSMNLSAGASLTVVSNGSAWRLP